MMERLLPLLLFSAVAAAQTPVLDLDRIEVLWPSPPPLGSFSYTGADQMLVVGAFVPDTQGRAAVVLRGGAWYMSYEPALFDHLIGVSSSGPIAAVDEAIGTLPAVAGGPDRLVVLRPAGLEVWKYDPVSGFGPETTQGPDGAFVGATAVRAASYTVGGVPQGFVIGVGPTWVRPALVDAAYQVYSGNAINAPPGAQVLDAQFVQWVAGGQPEVAVLTTVGMFIVDGAGNAIAAQPRAMTGGRLCALRIDDVPSVCAVSAVSAAGAQWRIVTWKSGSALNLGNPFDLPGAPTGIAPLDIDGDAYPEVIVSATDSVRRIFIGTVNGPNGGAGRLDVADVRPVNLPPNPAPNDVAVVVDDIDYDGNVDFVIQQTASNRLVVMLDARPQVQFEAYQNVDPGDATETVHVVDVLGQQDGGIEAWMFPSTVGDAALGLSVSIPAGTPATALLQVIVYPFVDGAVAVDQMQVFRFDLAPDSVGNVLDVLLPVEPAPGAPHTTNHCVLESSLVFANGSATKPLLFEHLTYYDPPQYGELLETLNATWTELWPFDATAFGQGAWSTYEGLLTEPSTPPPAPIPNTWPSRYIGTIVAVKATPGKPVPPKALGTTMLTNGVLHVGH